MNTRPIDRVFSYFDDSNQPHAVAALRSYYGSHHHYTGSAFDELITVSSPYEYTTNAIVAVSMLSVTVPPRAALGLLEGVASELLETIPSQASVWANPELLDRDGAAWNLWSLVDGYDNVGRTKASKILAAKRPGLIPVYDQHVAAALGLGENYWAFWQEAARNTVSAGKGDPLASVEEARTLAEVPAHVSLLRIIDVVVWMRHHGWKMHADDCQLRCDVRSFAIT